MLLSGLFVIDRDHRRLRDNSRGLPRRRRTMSTRPWPVLRTRTPGRRMAPWKTLSRAASAAELQPGDTVLIHTGVYREHVEVKVSGEPEGPITFLCCAGQRGVVVKGSAYD